MHAPSVHSTYSMHSTQGLEAEMRLGGNTSGGSGGAGRGSVGSSAAVLRTASQRQALQSVAAGGSHAHDSLLITGGAPSFA